MTTSHGGGTQRVEILGVNVVSSALNVNASFDASQVGITGVDVTNSALDVNAVVTPASSQVVSAIGGLAVRLVNTSGQVQVTSPALAVSAAGGTLGVGGNELSAARASLSAIRADMDRLEAAVTASALEVKAVVEVAALTAAELYAFVNTSGPPATDEETFGRLHMTSAHALHVREQGPIAVSGEVSLRGTPHVTIGGIGIASSALAVNIATPGTNIGVSAVALPTVVVSGEVSLRGTPHVTLGGIGIASSALAVNIASPGANIGISAAALPGIVASISGDVRVTAAGGLLNVNVANISGNVKITAANGTPLPVNQLGVNVANSAQESYGALRGDAIYNAQVSNPVKFGKIAQVAGAVCADIVAAVASRRIRVLGGYFNSTGTATAIFMTTGASAALTPKIVVYGGFVLPANPYGYFQTAVGSALTLQIEAGSVGGFITYQEVV